MCLLFFSLSLSLFSLLTRPIILKMKMNIPFENGVYSLCRVIEPTQKHQCFMRLCTGIDFHGYSVLMNVCDFILILKYFHWSMAKTNIDKSKIRNKYSHLYNIYIFSDKNLVKIDLAEWSIAMRYRALFHILCDKTDRFHVLSFFSSILLTCILKLFISSNQSLFWL